MQVNIARVLVAVDLAPSARTVLAWGKTLASRHGAALDVIHVWGHPGPAELAEDVRREARRELDVILGGEVHVDLIAGDAAEELCARAKRYDLVLLGSHGRRGLAHVLLGSVAERVVRGAGAAVLVIPVR